MSLYLTAEELELNTPEPEWAWAVEKEYPASEAGYSELYRRVGEGETLPHEEWRAKMARHLRNIGVHPDIAQKVAIAWQRLGYRYRDFFRVFRRSSDLLKTLELILQEAGVELASWMKSIIEEKLRVYSTELFEGEEEDFLPETESLEEEISLLKARGRGLLPDLELLEELEEDIELLQELERGGWENIPASLWAAWAAHTFTGEIRLPREKWEVLLKRIEEDLLEEESKEEELKISLYSLKWIWKKFICPRKGALLYDYLKGKKDCLFSLGNGMRVRIDKVWDFYRWWKSQAGLHVSSFEEAWRLFEQRKGKAPK